MRAGLRQAIGPAVAPIELGDEQQEAVIGGVDVAGERKNLSGQFVDRTHIHLHVKPARSYTDV
jgi:hypothetical protein